MYAEVRVFEDDGRPMNNQPYLIPTVDAHIVNDIDKDYKIIQYTFKFSMTKAEPVNPVTISNIDREHMAYQRGLEEGRREILRKGI